MKILHQATLSLLSADERNEYGQVLRKLTEEPFDLSIAGRLAGLLPRLPEQGGYLSISRSGRTDAVSLGQKRFERIGHYKVWCDKSLVTDSIYWEHDRAEHAAHEPVVYRIVLVRGAPIAFIHRVPIETHALGVVFTTWRNQVVWRRLRWYRPSVSLEFCIRWQ